MSKIRVGIIGLGSIAQAVHIPGILACRDMELTAICDINDERLALCAEKYGIGKEYLFTGYRELINCRDIDAIDICTPNDCHFNMAMEAVSAGKPYSLEKPVTLNAGQADILAEHTEKAGIKNMICFSYRFKAAARYAKDLIERGLLGDLYHVDMQYFQAWGLPDANTPLVWRFIAQRAGSGALGDLGCHGLDLVRFVTGKEYIKVAGHAGTYVKSRRLPEGEGTGTPDVDDFCNCMALMESGISASFQITRFAFGRGNYQRMEVYGSKGSLVYKLDETPGKDELEICIGPAAGETHTFTKIEVPARFHADQMQSFADIVKGCGDGMPAVIEDGRLNQHVVDAILQSVGEEKWIQLQ